METIQAYASNTSGYVLYIISNDLPSIQNRKKDFNEGHINLPLAQL